MALGVGSGHGAAGLNRRRGPKKGLSGRYDRRSAEPFDNSAPSAEEPRLPSPSWLRAKARIEELERFGWSPTTRPRFFRQGLALADALQGPAPGAWRIDPSRSSKI